MGKLKKPMEGLITDIWSQNFIPRTFRKIIRIELELQSSILDSRVELHTSKKSARSFSRELHSVRICSTETLMVLEKSEPVERKSLQCEWLKISTNKAAIVVASWRSSMRKSIILLVYSQVESSFSIKQFTVLTLLAFRSFHPRYWTSNFSFSASTFNSHYITNLS